MHKYVEIQKIITKYFSCKYLMRNSNIRTQNKVITKNNYPLPLAGYVAYCCIFMLF